MYFPFLEFTNQVLSKTNLNVIQVKKGKKKKSFAKRSYLRTETVKYFWICGGQSFFLLFNSIGRKTVKRSLTFKDRGEWSRRNSPLQTRTQQCTKLGRQALWSVQPQEDAGSRGRAGLGAGVVASQTAALTLADLKTLHLGLFWWLSSKESAWQCRRRRFDPWSGKIMHAE